MATKTWIGGAPEIAQVVDVTPANVEVDDIFTITLSNDEGESDTLSFTATAATVQNVVEGIDALADAAKTAGVKPWDDVTVTEDDTKLTITADTAGTRFYVDASATDGGGTDTQTFSASTVTDNSGPFDWQCADNWDSDTLPATGDSVIVPSSAAYPILYGLVSPSSAWALNSFIIENGFTLGVGHYRQSLEVTLNGATGSEIVLGGTGQTFIKVMGGQDPIYVTDAGQAGYGACGLNIEAAVAVDYDVHISTISAQACVGLAPLSDHTGKFNTVEVKGGATVIVGTQVTDSPAIQAEGSDVVTQCALTSFSGRDSNWRHEAGACPTVTLDGGESLLRSPDMAAGTSLTIQNGAILNIGPQCSAITTVNIYGREWQVWDEFETIANFQLHGCRPSDGLLVGKTNRKWTPGAIT
jgi:hypothetical protein